MSKSGLYFRWFLLAAAMVGAFVAAGLWQGAARWGLVLWYLGGVNLATVLLYLYDKDAARAQRGQRVPELILHLLALAGGSPGALVAQRAFRHKTRKAGFRNVYWLIVAGQAALAVRGALMRGSPAGVYGREWVFVAVGFLVAMNVLAGAVYAHGTRRRSTSATLGYLLVFGGGALGAALTDRLADGVAWWPYLAGGVHLAGVVYLACYAVTVYLPWL